VFTHFITQSKPYARSKKYAGLELLVELIFLHRFYYLVFKFYHTSCFNNSQKLYISNVNEIIINFILATFSTFVLS